MDINDNVPVAYALPVASNIIEASMVLPVAGNPKASRYLTSRGWPMGLQDAVIQNLTRYPMRFYICDDSHKMRTNDGHKLIPFAPGSRKYIKCTRWEELADMLRIHANLAHTACAASDFRLLNSDRSVLVGTIDDNESDNLNSLLSLLDRAPRGEALLCKHVNDVIDQIWSMEDQLRLSEQMACIIIATNSVASDGDLLTVMRRLRGLPARVVVRLCTAEEEVVDYWNKIKTQLGLNMIVLGGLCCEATKIHTHNPWITYGQPLHRLREFGIVNEEVDLLCSRPLTPNEIRKLCSFIFGGALDSYPHPEEDFKGLLAALNRHNYVSSKVWDPVTTRTRSWIHRRYLYHIRPAGNCTIS